MSRRYCQVAEYTIHFAGRIRRRLPNSKKYEYETLHLTHSTALLGVAIPKASPVQAKGQVGSLNLNLEPINSVKQLIVLDKTVELNRNPAIRQARKSAPRLGLVPNMTEGFSFCDHREKCMQI